MNVFGRKRQEKITNEIPKEEIKEPYDPFPSSGMNVCLRVYRTVDNRIETAGVWLHESNGVMLLLEDRRSVIVFKDGSVFFGDDQGRVVDTKDANSWGKIIRRPDEIESESPENSQSADNGDRTSVEEVP